MPRYFLELRYKGTGYSGFQVQENAMTIQSEVEKSLQILYRQSFSLTGSSRTDAGVHALQNFFHFDTDLELQQKDIYNLNAILPADIAATAYYTAGSEAHTRFGAVSRSYRYYIYRRKNPFLRERAWYYPFDLNVEVLQNVAQMVKDQSDFTSFSKRNTQVQTFSCSINTSYWEQDAECLIYNVSANRFLRGMVRGLVSSMLKTARGSITMEQFSMLLKDPRQASADFSAPAHGLFLVSVNYPDGYIRLLD